MEKIKSIINLERITSLLSDLVSIESPYFHEEEIMKFVYTWLEKAGLPASFHRYHEKKITNFKGMNVVGELKGQYDGPTIVLNGHLDTVDLCEGWTKDPYKGIVEDGRLYGLGALDMKSGDTAILLALEAFKETIGEFNGSILYTFVSDEEGPYGLGTDALISGGLLHDGDIAIVPEPSAGFCGIEFPCLGLGARGGWNYKVTVRGRSSHAANPEKEDNAVTKAARLMLALEESEPLTHPKMGPGAIAIIQSEGGGAACSIPDTAQFTVFRHVTIGEEQSFLRKELARAAEKAGIGDSYTMEFRDGPSPESAGFQPYITSESNPYTKTIKESIVTVTGRPANIGYFSSIGDFNYLGTRSRLPTYVFGADGENYHGADEFVVLDTVVQTALVIYDFLVRTLVNS